MWTLTTRRQYSRDGLRYETDLTDAESAVVEPLMPEPCRCGRPRTWPLREILNAIFYVAWRLIPKDLGRRCIAGLRSGATGVCSSTSTTCSSWQTESGSDERHRPVPP